MMCHQVEQKMLMLTSQTTSLSINEHWMKISISLLLPVHSYITKLNQVGYAQLKWDLENFVTTDSWLSYNFARREWIADYVSFHNFAYMEIYKCTSVKRCFMGKLKLHFLWMLEMKC